MMVFCFQRQNERFTYSGHARRSNDASSRWVAVGVQRRRPFGGRDRCAQRRLVAASYAARQQLLESELAVQIGIEQFDCDANPAGDPPLYARRAPLVPAVLELTDLRAFDATLLGEFFTRQVQPNPTKLPKPIANGRLSGRFVLTRCHVQNCT